MDRAAAPDRMLDSLAQTLARIAAVERELSALQLITSPGGGAWSPNEVLWHIRATADVHGEHIRRIVSEDEPHWRHVSPRARMKKSRYDELPFAESFAAFAEQRRDLVQLLTSLAPESWRRAAVVRVAHRQGELRFTLHQHVWAMADHEEGHCAQIEGLAATLGSRR
jgi:hypothetical protein